MADLVVDAGGPGSHTPQWLRGLNYPRPEETTVHIGLSYASRTYTRPPQPRDWKAMIIYEKLPHFPDGLVVIGDAFCRFDPIFGQGMTVAAKEAVALGDMLSAAKARQQPPNTHGFSGQFHKQLAKVVETPWMLATTEAFRYPQVAGKRPVGTRFNHWYTSQIFELTAGDPTVYSAFLQVLHLLKEPTSLFRPAILWRVLRHQMRGLGLMHRRQPLVENQTVTGDIS